MSNNTDTRVVELQFNNKDFEKNAKKSMKTLGALQASMDMNDTTKKLNKSLEQINDNTSLLAATTEKISKQWGVWEVVAITAINRITNKVIDLGKKMVKALSVDNIAGGWEKFNASVRTEATLLSQGFDKKDIAAFTEYISEWSDASSYSADVMSRTAQSIAQNTDLTLEEASNVAVGISTWIAQAGKGVNDLAGVANQVTQALQLGYLGGNDLKSLKQTWGVFTKEMQNVLKETAIKEGKIYKISDNLYKINNKIYTEAELMSTAISEEKWITTDVLQGALTKYSSAVAAAMEYARKKGMRLYEVIERFDELVISDGMDPETEAMLRFGLQAAKSAQECRTYADAINAIKDAVSSGWKKMYSNIIGGSEQATELWSRFYDYLSPIFTDGIEFLTKSTDLFSLMGGREDLFGFSQKTLNKMNDELQELTAKETNSAEEIERIAYLTERINNADKNNIGMLGNLLESVNEIRKMIGESVYEVFFGIDTQAENAQKSLAAKLKKLTESINRFSKRVNKFIADNRNTIKNIIKIIFNGIKMIVNILRIGINLIKAVVTGLKPLLGLLGGGSSGLLKLTEKINKQLEKFVNTSKIFTRITAKTTRATTKLTNTIKEMDIMEKISNGFEKFKQALLNNGKTVKSIKKIWSSFKIIMTTLGKGLLKIIPKLVGLLGKALSKAVVYLAKGIDKLANGMSYLIKKINELRNNKKVVDIYNKIVDLTSRSIKKLGNGIQYLGSKLFNFVKSFKWSRITKVLKTIWSLLVKVAKGVKSVVSTIYNSGLKKGLEELKNLFKGTKKGISDTADTAAKKTSKFSKLANTLKKYFGPVVDIMKSLKNFALSVLKVLKKVIDIFTSIFDVLGDLLGKIESRIKKIPNLFENKRVKELIDKFKGVNLLKKVAIIAGLLVLVKIIKTMADTMSIISSLSDVLWSFSKILRAKAFESIAVGINLIVKSIIEMAVAIAALGTLAIAKPEVIRKGIAAIAEITGLFTLFIGALLLMTKVFGNKTVLDYNDEVSFFGKAFNRKSKGTTTALAQTSGAILRMARVTTKLASAILLLTIPIKILGSMKQETFEKGFKRTSDILSLIVIYIAALALAVRTSKKKDDTSAKEMNKDFRVIKMMTKSLVGVVGAIASIAVIISRVGKLSENTFKKGFKRVRNIMILIGLFEVAIISASMNKSFKKAYDKSSTTESNADSIKAIGFNLILLSGAIFIMSKAIGKFADMKLTKLLKGMASLSIVILLILGVLKATSKITTLVKAINASKTVTSTTVTKSITTSLKDVGILILSLAAALASITFAMLIISTMSTGQIKRSLGIITLIVVGLLGIVTVFSWLNNKIGKGSGEVNKTNTNIKDIRLIIVAMSTLAATFAILSVMSKSQITKGLAALSIISGALVIVMGLMTLINKMNNKEGAVKSQLISLIAIVASIIALGILFKTLGSMSWSQIGRAAAVMGIISGILLGIAALAAVIGLIPGADLSIGIIAGLAAAIALAILSLATVLDVLDRIDIESICDKLGYLAQWFIDNSDLIVDSAMALGEALVGGLVALILGAIPGIVKAFTTFVTEVLKAITERITEWGNALFDIAIKIMDVLIARFPEFGKKILEFFQKVVDFITHDCAEFLGKNNMIVAGMTFIKYFLKGIEQGFRSLGSVFNNLVDNVKGFGKNVISGLWDGIKSMGSWFKNKFIGWIKDHLPKAVCKVLDIRSPSHVMAQLGEFTVQGLANGIEDGGKTVESAISSVANTITDGVDDVITITPIMDLSQIQNGTEEMNAMLDSTNGYVVDTKVATGVDSSISKSRASTLREASKITQPATNENYVLNNTFNITGNANPDDIADAVSKKIAEQISRRKTTWQ